MNTDAAFVELADAKRAVKASRRAFATTPASRFVKAMWQAMALYLGARRDGVSREDAARGLEEELRAAWPKSVSKFAPACGDCEDTGYVEHICWERHRCGRRTCAENPERQHAFVEPCICAKGQKFTAKVRHVSDAIAAAGRTQKKRGMSRFGQ